ncbi:hypothetical protein C0J29_12890 [Mycobacterium paragordonae]|nr:hypothetical protein C0J29_12890 [Mycobacterium paragordonae]OBJ79421.1 hypothetical protein A9W97_30740 [Mycobacterium gordonae]TDK95683.1 hypothetical protein EI067_15730 [Mycobacterium paragordonae]
MSFTRSSTRVAIAAVAAGLSLAACSSSHTAGPSTSPSTAVAAPTTSASAPPKGETQVRGLIASVAGNAVQVTQQSGTATVDFSGSTKISEVSAGALTDVAVGSCVTARSKDEGQPAASVRVSQEVDGKCPQGKQPTTPGRHAPIQGTVASVNGETITVNTAGAPQTVTVTDKTKYTKEAPATSEEIAQGKCITARGSENGGALQATSISVRQAADGKCPDGAGRHPR